MVAVLEIARSYLAVGLSVIPILADGSKAPAVPTWKKYQQERPGDRELRQWWGATGRERVLKPGHGIAVVCGRVSALEVLDFDGEGPWQEWLAIMQEQFPEVLERVRGFPRVVTPGGGRHVYLFREAPGTSRKLALAGDGRTRIEIKGEGGYVLAPGCPPECHLSGRTYEWRVPLLP